MSGHSYSVPGKTILFGAHNILSVVQYIEKYGGKAAVVSYDLFKAFDRVNLDFLYKVMEAMHFPKLFIQWIQMVHSGSTTSFLLSFLTKSIKLLISLRQGDPIAMPLFIIFMEPLLMMIRKKIRGTVLFGEVGNKSALWGNYSGGLECVKTNDQGYVDDVNVCIQDEDDLLVFDESLKE